MPRWATATPVVKSGASRAEMLTNDFTAPCSAVGDDPAPLHHLRRARTPTAPVVLGSLPAGAAHAPAHAASAKDDHRAEGAARVVDLPVNATTRTHTLHRARMPCPEHHATLCDTRDRYRGSSTAQGYGVGWRALRLAILARDPVCTDASGCAEPSTDADHIIPRRQGGSDDPDNLQGMCHAHHSRKTASHDGGYGHAVFAPRARGGAGQIIAAARCQERCVVSRVRPRF
jgi:5-methylcytosine-specific restriction endonuclease McrA